MDMHDSKDKHNRDMHRHARCSNEGNPSPDSCRCDNNLRDEGHTLETNHPYNQSTHSPIYQSIKPYRPMEHIADEEPYFLTCAYVACFHLTTDPLHCIGCSNIRVREPWVDERISNVNIILKKRKV